MVFFYLVHGAAADDLHNIYECAAKVHTHFLLTVAPRVDPNMGYDAMCRIIDDRLKKVRTPSCISRKPGNCSITKRGSVTGTEWRNWTRYAAVPCLEGLVQANYVRHFELLSRFAFILSQGLITDGDLEEANACIRDYLIQFEINFGIGATRINMHALSHGIRSVRDLGGYWVCICVNPFINHMHLLLRYGNFPYLCYTPAESVSVSEYVCIWMLAAWRHAELSLTWLLMLLENGCTCCVFVYKNID